MYRCDILLEKGVQIATVDRAARAAIRKGLPDIVAEVRTTAATDIGSYEWQPPDHDNDPYGDLESRKRDRYYDSLTHWLDANEQTVVPLVCRALSGVLTPLANQIMRDRLDRPSGVEVELEARDFSDDRHKHYGGYFSHFGLIKVFVDANEVAEAIRGVLQDDMFGEDSEGLVDKFINLIVPTFVHEYAHYEQGARGRSKGTSLGLITSGKPGRVGGKRQSKRTGELTEPRKSPQHWFRYLGALHEIDSFAAGAVSEIVQEFRRRWDDTDIDSDIKSTYESIAQGWVDVPSYRRYRDLLDRSVKRDEWDDPAAQELKQHEVDKVWRRFNRLVYQKLQDFLAPRIGQTTAQQVAKFPKTFLSLAKALPRGKMIAWLARYAATKMAGEDKWETQYRLKNIDYVLDENQRQAEDFIRYYFFDNDWEKEQAMDQAIAIFRNMLKRLIVAQGAEHGR